MVVETLAQLGDKTDHFEINDAAKMQHLFWDRGSIVFSSFLKINKSNLIFEFIEV